MSSEIGRVTCCNQQRSEKVIGSYREWLWGGSSGDWSWATVGPSERLCDQAWHEIADVTAPEEQCGHGQCWEWVSRDLKISEFWTNIRPPVPLHNQKGLVWYKNSYSNSHLISLVREKASTRLDAILIENKKPSEIFSLCWEVNFTSITLTYHTSHTFSVIFYS